MDYSLRLSVENIYEDKPLELPVVKKPEPVVKVAPVLNSYGKTDKYDWLRKSGIPEKDWAYVDYIITRESGWQPCAYFPSKVNCNLTAAQVNATNSNPDRNVACGLGMQLPCGKWAHNWNDPVGGLIDANNYALQRYGSWYNAMLYWQQNHVW